jgi:hypothetical protein
MPRDVEGRAAQNPAAVGEVIEKNLAEDDRSVVETVHGFLPDVFLGAGALGPR